MAIRRAGLFATKLGSLTACWKPDIIISDENNEVTFEFYASDFPTMYSVVIEGLTSDGHIVQQAGKIQVK
jgi:hypothetical protein